MYEQLHGALWKCASVLGDVAVIFQWNKTSSGCVRRSAAVKQPEVGLAITVDAAKPFVRKTYTLEGEGPLAMEAYLNIRILRL